MRQPSRVTRLTRLTRHRHSSESWNPSWSWSSIRRTRCT